MRADDDRLDHTALAHAAGQFIQRIGIERLARLVWIGPDIGNRDRAQSLDDRPRGGAAFLGRLAGDNRLFALDIAEEAVQPPAQSGHPLGRALGRLLRRLLIGHQAATLRSGRRPISSRARSI